MLNSQPRVSYTFQRLPFINTFLFTPLQSVLELEGFFSQVVFIMNAESFDAGDDSGFESSKNSSLHNSSSTNSSIYHCPVWSWKVDRLWRLQNKTHDIKDQGCDAVEDSDTNYYLESLKFGAELQANFLPSLQQKSVKVNAVKAASMDDINRSCKSVYKFDHHSRNSNYLWLESRATLQQRQQNVKSLYQN